MVSFFENQGLVHMEFMKNGETIKLFITKSCNVCANQSVKKDQKYEVPQICIFIMATPYLKKHFQ